VIFVSRELVFRVGSCMRTLCTVVRECVGLVTDR